VAAAPVLCADGKVGEGLEEGEGGGVGGVWGVVWIAGEGVDGVTLSFPFSISCVRTVRGGADVMRSLSEVKPGVRSANDGEVGEGAEDGGGDGELCVLVLRCEDETGDVG